MVENHWVQSQCKLTTLLEELPVHDVSQQVVVLEPVIDVHLLVVDRQRARVDATLLKQKINRYQSSFD